MTDPPTDPPDDGEGRSPDEAGTDPTRDDEGRSPDDAGDGSDDGAGNDQGHTDAGADDGLPVSRRALLGGGLAAVAGLGAGAYLTNQGGDEEGSIGTSAKLPYAVWKEARTALRASPDHLPGTADELVSEGDPEAMFEFVRDDVATRPPAARDSEGFPTATGGGPRAALRSGMGTPREKAELLASLLDRAGYETKLLRYGRGLSADQLKGLYLGGTDREFAPEVDPARVRAWNDLLGTAPVEGRAFVDEDGAESASLGERIRSAHPDLPPGDATGFDWGSGAGAVPVVAFRERPDSAGESGTTTGETTGTTTGGTATPTETATATPTGTTTEGSGGRQWRYADLFHPDESFGSLSNPDATEAIPPRDSPTVAVTLEAATADAPEERMELVSGLWEAHQLAGRQLVVDTHPGLSPLHYPSLRFRDVRRFVPALAVQDPDESRQLRERLSVLGDPFSVTGDRLAVEFDGTVSRNGTALQEGEQDPKLVLEAPDGTEHTVTPIRSEGSAKAYYDYDDENSVSSNTPDGLEVESATVTFLHENTGTGELSLVVINDVAGSSDGGKATMRFEGVNGYRWQETDDPMDGGNDFYGAPKSILGATETALWRWNSPNTDGGVIGTLSDTFDVGMTHLEEGSVRGVTQQRENVDRWLFLDGENPGEPIELADFTADAGDASARVYVEEPPEPPGPPSVPDTAADVSSLDVVADPGEFPRVSLEVSATTSDGTAVEGLPGSAFEVTEGGESVVADQTGVSSYTFAYRTDSGSVGDQRTVTVRVPEAGVEGTATYTIPEATDAREVRGLSGLYLTVEVGDRTVRRTLAGWDPQLDGDREPTPADHREVLSALYGQHTLGFESAGVPASVHLDDHVASNLSLKTLYEARDEDSDARDAAMREGIESVMSHPSHFHPPLPDRVTGDSLTYGTGLRVTLHGQRLDPEAPSTTQTVDVLSTADVRTLTREGDGKRAFELTMDRTARLAVLERELFDTSTASLLADADLVPASEVGEWSDGTRKRFRTARDRYGPISDDYHLTGAGGSTAAFWNVDGETGEVTGVLPDGTGGAESIKEIIERVGRLIEVWNKIASNAPKGTIGSAASYFSTLMKLYGIATVSIATMTMKELPQGQKLAISRMVCNVAKKISWSYAGITIQANPDFMNNLRGVGNGGYDCG